MTSYTGPVYGRKNIFSESGNWIKIRIYIKMNQTNMGKKPYSYYYEYLHVIFLMFIG